MSITLTAALLAAIAALPAVQEAERDGQGPVELTAAAGPPADDGERSGSSRSGRVPTA